MQPREGRVHPPEPLPCSWVAQPCSGMSLPLHWAAARKRRSHLLLLSLWLPASIQLQSGSCTAKAQCLWATISSHRPCICCASNMTLRPHPVTHPGRNNVNQSSVQARQAQCKLHAFPLVSHSPSPLQREISWPSGMQEKP